MSEISAIRTDDAPAAIGPYSQGIRSGDLVFTSGHLPMCPRGEIIRDDVESAARQALENVFGVLRAAGAQPADVIKVTVFLADLEDFAAVNGVYAEAFAEPFPARSCVQVARLPKDAPLEIEAVARIGSTKSG